MGVHSKSATGEVLSILTMLRLLLSLCLGLVVAAENTKLAEPDLTKIKFFLWTRQNPDAYDTVQLTQESLEDSHFDSRHPTIILAHGWNSHGDGFGENLSEAYFEVGDYNVFAIEWGDLETWANYPQAAIRTRAVGEHSANLVKILSDVGAIDKSDAKFVDIIHTNSGMLWNGCLSIKKSIGHVDIYPAGGSHQPGCVEACIIPDIMCYNITIEDLIKGGCSHERAVSYYKESISVMEGGQEFRAWNCESWEDFQEGNCCEREQVVMGEWMDNSVPEGKYFLKVKEEKPFAMGQGGNGCCFFDNCDKNVI